MPVWQREKLTRVTDRVPWCGDLPAIPDPAVLCTRDASRPMFTPTTGG